MLTYIAVVLTYDASVMHALLSKTNLKELGQRPVPIHAHSKSVTDLLTPRIPRYGALYSHKVQTLPDLCAM